VATGYYAYSPSAMQFRDRGSFYSISKNKKLYSTNSMTHKENSLAIVCERGGNCSGS
jgi:hypothetical protein